MSELGGLWIHKITEHPLKSVRVFEMLKFNAIHEKEALIITPSQLHGSYEGEDRGRICEPV